MKITIIGKQRHQHLKRNVVLFVVSPARRDIVQPNVRKLMNQKIEEIKFSEYSRTLPLAEEIYKVLSERPTTARQIAERFNRVGDINRLIIKHDKQAKLHTNKPL